MDIDNAEQSERFWLHFDALLQDEVPHKAVTFVRNYAQLHFHATATNDVQVDSSLLGQTQLSSRPSKSTSTPFFTALNQGRTPSDGANSHSNSQHTVISISSSTSTPHAVDEIPSQASSDALSVKPKPLSAPANEVTVATSVAKDIARDDEEVQNNQRFALPTASPSVSEPKPLSHKSPVFSTASAAAKTPQPLQFSICGSFGGSLPASLHSPVQADNTPSAKLASGIDRVHRCSINTAMRPVSGDSGASEDSSNVITQPLTRDLEAYPAWMLSLVERELSGVKTLLFVETPDHVRKMLLDQSGLQDRVRFLLDRCVEYLEVYAALPKYGPIQRLYFKLSREKLKWVKVASTRWVGANEGALENVKTVLLATLDRAEVIPCVRRFLEKGLIDTLVATERTDAQRQEYVKILVAWRIVRSISLIYGFQNVFTSTKVVKQFELLFTRDFSEEETAFSIVEALVAAQHELTLTIRQRVGIDCWTLNRAAVENKTMQSFISCTGWCRPARVATLYARLKEAPAIKQVKSISVCGDLEPHPRNTLKLLAWVPQSSCSSIDKWVQGLEQESLVHSACTTSNAKGIAEVSLIVYYEGRYLPVEIIVCLREDAEVYKVVNSFYSPKKREVDNWCKILKRKAPRTPRDLAQYVSALQQEKR